ncbi:NAD(P)/FAD-dependent oxidoreductase [soil metagenome]
MGKEVREVGTVTDKANAWLHEFEKAISTRDDGLLEGLFIEGANWRDILAFTWNLRQFHGREQIQTYLWTAVDEISPSNFALDESLPVPAISLLPLAPYEAYEVNFTFETAAGYADGLVNVVPDDSSPAGLRAELLFTRLKVLRGHEPKWPQFGRYNHEEIVNERQVKQSRLGYANHEPEVLIVGGGHNGAMAAVALARLGIDALIIDRNERVGDNWRKRYESLVLHQPHGMMHFFDLPYPESYPDYLSKDRLADWFEIYVKTFDLNFWTSTEFLDGTYDKEKKEWDARVRLSDGSVRTFHPKHLILATGGSGTPRIPDLPGIAEFTGDVLHTTQFRSGADFAGKKVLVIGAGTSAHDTAFDVFNHGGSATMLQRGPIAIVNLDSANLSYADANARVIPIEILDKRFLSGMIEPSLRGAFKFVAQMGNELDKQTHEGLEAVGFKLDRDEYGWFNKYFETASGYYINVGASDAIIRGDIEVRQFDEFERFNATGITLKNGESLEFDAVVLATGFENQRAILERFFGVEVADAIGDVYGFDAGGEPFKNAFRPLEAQPGLTVMDSGIAAGRWYAPVVALEIAAEFDGVVPETFSAEGHPARTPVDALVKG